MISRNHQRAQKISIPHTVDIDYLLQESERLINFVYDNNIIGRYQLNLPEEIRKGAMNGSTISGILWYCARKDRPKVKYAPFILVYAKYLAYDPEQKAILLINQNHLVFPAPILPEDTTIRWVVIERDMIHYYYKASSLVLMQEKFNINQIPNPVFVEDTGDD